MILHVSIDQSMCGSYRTFLPLEARETDSGHDLLMSFTLSSLLILKTITYDNETLPTQLT